MPLMCQRRKCTKPAQFQGVFLRLGPSVNPFHLCSQQPDVLFAVLANYLGMQGAFDIVH